MIISEGTADYEFPVYTVPVRLEVDIAAPSSPEYFIKLTEIAGNIRSILNGYGPAYKAIAEIVDTSEVFISPMEQMQIFAPFRETTAEMRKCVRRFRDAVRGTGLYLVSVGTAVI